MNSDVVGIWPAMALRRAPFDLGLEPVSVWAQLMPAGD